jgi:hypothetical protein
LAFAFSLGCSGQLESIFWWALETEIQSLRGSWAVIDDSVIVIGGTCPELTRYRGIRYQLVQERDMIARRPLIFVASALTLITTSAWAATGAEVLKMLNRDSDQTLEIAEVIDAATKLFAQINLDNDLTLERKEAEGRLTDADWKAVNKDNDNTLEMDEWLTIVRQRFNAADANKDGKLTVQELDSAPGQLLIKLVVK